MHKFKLAFCLLVISISCFSANDRLDLAVSAIPDSLKKNALGVVRFSSTVFEYKSETSGFEKHTSVITVLDQKGKELANFQYSGDKFSQLTDFSGKLYDASGKFLRKFKMSDVVSSEMTNGNTLATDAKHHFFNCETPSFPFTIEYEYEVSLKNGILVFPVFFPQDEYDLSVEKADYLLILPEKLELRKKAINISAEPQKWTEKDRTSYRWTVENLKAIESELFDPGLENYVPLLYLSPKSFMYDNTQGTISDWCSMGKWENTLLKDRNILTEETKTKIFELTKNAKTDREKVKILYDYLGKTTRYVSIQLGIGGYQPMPAAEVCKTGFGDCKALSNYLKAMLAVVGIPANYTGIRSDKYRKTLFADYANFYQMNHIILQVPLPNDTLWLECTNPRVPFGFVHNTIAGHDALVINEMGGKIVRLPDYADSLNIEKNIANVVLNADGGAKVKMKKYCLAKIYDNYDQFPLKKITEQTDDLREEIQIPSATMGVVQVKEDKSPMPSILIDYSWTTPLYGSKTGNRLFVPVNPFRSSYSGLKKSKRQHDIRISAGYKDVDSIFIPIPEGYEIETMPASNQLKTMFGCFDSTIKIKETGIVIFQSLLVPSGYYKASDYTLLLAFFEKISTNYNSKIIFRKKSA